MITIKQIVNGIFAIVCVASILYISTTTFNVESPLDFAIFTLVALLGFMYGMNNSIYAKD